MENMEVSCVAERLSVKSVCASDILQNVLSAAKELEVFNKRLTRYVAQIQLLLTWRRGSAALKMAGSAAKSVASLMVLAAPLHPQLRLAVGVGHKLWKLGMSLKILNTLANIVRDLWQDGCRKCLLDFAHTAALLTRNLGVFSEVISDLQNTVRRANTVNSLETPRQFFNLIKPFIPRAQHIYVAHVASIVLGSERYSPLFDFAALMSDPTDQSLSLQLARELESLNFTEFVAESDVKSLVAVSTFLHVSRELIDFLDGFHQFTDKDCTFLHECLVKFNQESRSIVKVVSFLVSLTRERSGEAAKGNNSQSPPQLSKESQDEGLPCGADQRSAVITSIQQDAMSHESQSDTDCNRMEVDASNNVSASSCPASSNNTADSSSSNNPRGQDTGEAGLKKLIMSKAFSSLSGLVKISNQAVLSISSQKSKAKDNGQDADGATSQFQEEKDKTKI